MIDRREQKRYQRKLSPPISSPVERLAQLTDATTNGEITVEGGIAFRRPDEKVRPDSRDPHRWPRQAFGGPFGRPSMADESLGKIIAGRLLSLELGLAFCPAMMCPGKPLETAKRLQS